MASQTDPLALPFGDPRRLIGAQPGPNQFCPTRQDAAIVICGGGDPFAEARDAIAMCESVDMPYMIFVGNDMIEHWPGHVDHACTLHPPKVHLWRNGREKNGFEPIHNWWSYRPFTSFNHWTRDWAGSTGLFCVKIARELGFVHIILCGVHMSAGSGHFVRKENWAAADGFLNGWRMRLASLKPYVRSFGGWTYEQFGAPTPELLLDHIEDKHLQMAPPTILHRGLRA